MKALYQNYFEIEPFYLFDIKIVYLFDDLYRMMNNV